MKKVVIVENIKTIREGIKILINRFSSFECDESFEDFSLFKENIPELKPEILLIDFQHKGISIIDEIKALQIYGVYGCMGGSEEPIVNKKEPEKMQI